MKFARRDMERQVSRSGTDGKACQLSRKWDRWYAIPTIPEVGQIDYED